MLDFAADENVAVLPAWMIEELKMGGNGAAVFIKTVEQFQKVRSRKDNLPFVWQDPPPPPGPSFFSFSSFCRAHMRTKGTGTW